MNIHMYIYMYIYICIYIYMYMYIDSKDKGGDSLQPRVMMCMGMMCSNAQYACASTRAQSGVRA